MDAIVKEFGAHLVQTILINNSEKMINNSTAQQPEKDLLFVRHAQSLFNLGSHNIRHKYNLPYVWELLSQCKQFMDGVKYNREYIDCGLTEAGFKQCEQARKVFDTVKPDVILVSPLERTLLTCEALFSGRDIPIIVQPLLAEALRSSCDISRAIAGKKQRFPHFNFENVQKQGDLWYIKNQCQESQQKYNQALAKLPQEADTETKGHAVLDLMAETQIYETSRQVRQRSQRIKQLLRKYKQQYNTIAIVAHYNTINYTVAKLFGPEDEPENSADVKNCEIFRDNLEELLKTQ